MFEIMTKKRPPSKPKSGMQIEQSKKLLEKYSELLKLRDAVEQAVREANERGSSDDDTTGDD